MRWLTRLAVRLTDASSRWVPSAFVIACLLTALVMAAARVATGRSAGEILTCWGDGFWALLGFAMQMCLVMMTGSIIADSPASRRLLEAAARLPNSERQAVVFTAAASMILCWLHWGLGMIASAFLARAVALKRPKTDFRLLVAVAYFGMGAVWHAGLSGSAPLLVATPKHFLESSVGLVPLSETIFSPFNGGLLAATFAVLLALAWAMYPVRGAKGLDAAALARLRELPEEEGEAPRGAWLRFWERSYAVPLAVGGLGLAYVARDAAAQGFQLTLDKLNFLFLMIAVLSHPTPAAFARAAEKAAGYLHGVVIQFPFYAGMFGVIKGTGLDTMIAKAFVDRATPATFPLIVYLYSGVLNYFIPSGGSKWAIEAPYLLEAARALGVPNAKVVLAYAWGDMVTDIIQPFWCLPLLAVARLDFKDILGYEALAFLVCAGLGSAAFFFF